MKAEKHLENNTIGIRTISEANFFSKEHKDKKFIMDWVAKRALQIAREEVFEAIEKVRVSDGLHLEISPEDYKEIKERFGDGGKT